MQLKTKISDYVAEEISVISKAIKEGKADSLPTAIYHYYDSGKILIGVNGCIVIEINGEYKKVSDENYLLIPIGWIGKIQILKDSMEVKYHFDVVESA